MAFNVGSLTDYTDKATELFREVVLFSDNFSNYNIQPGISFKEYINWLDTSVYVQAGACGLSDSGTTNINEKVLTVGYYGIKLKYCYDDLRKKAVMTDNLEVELTNNVIENIARKVNEDMWAGDISGSGDLIDGLQTQAEADGDVITVTVSASTVSNIINNINELINGLPENYLTKYGELIIHTSMSIYNMYRQALTQGNYFNLKDSELEKFTMWVFGYEGKIKIKGEPGYGTSTDSVMFLTFDSNIFIGTDEIQTVSSLDIINDPITDFVYFKSKFKFGVTYMFGDGVVLLANY